MLKNIQGKLNNGVCLSSRNLLQNNNKKLNNLINFPKLNFATEPKRTVELEKDDKINSILKHKSFVSKIFRIFKNFINYFLMNIYKFYYNFNMFILITIVYYC